MIIICMDAHQRVITDCMTMRGNISVAYVWQSEYVLQYIAYYMQSYFFLFLSFYYSNYSYCIFLVLK